MSEYHSFDDDAAMAFALAIARFAADYEFAQLKRKEAEQ